MCPSPLLLSNSRRSVRTVCGIFLLAAPPGGVCACSDSLFRVSTETTDLFDVVERYAAEESGQDLYEDLRWLVEHPLDVNSATLEDLLRIPGIMPSDAQRVLRLRRRVGKLTSLDQIRRMGGGGRGLYLLLAPFVRIGTTQHFPLRTRSRWSWKWGRRAEEAHNPSLGPASREHHRLDVPLWEGVSCGLHMARDAGERYAHAFVSGYLRTRGLLTFDDLILGDYTVSTGLGLVLSAAGPGFGAVAPAGGKSIETRIEPFHGSTECNVLRGIAASKRLRFRSGTVQLLGLFSRTPLSASLDGTGEILTIDTESAFTEEADLVRRNAVSETTTALRGVLSLRDGLSMGTTVLYAELSRKHSGQGAFPKPHSFLTVSLDGAFDRGPLSLSTEWAWTKGGLALSGRCHMTLTEQTSVACTFWSYGAGYWSSKAGGIGAASETRNDRGIHFSWSGRIGDLATLTGFLQHHHRPWRTYFDPVPPSGMDFAVGVSVRVGAGVTLEARVASGRNEQADSYVTSGGMPGVRMVSVTRNRLRCGVDVSLGSAAGIRSRVDWCTLLAPGVHGGEKGWMLLQEARIVWPGVIRVYARAALYQTDSYASRLYAQERDVEGVYSNPPYYGTGFRWYLMFRQALSGGVSLSAKYSVSTGSGGVFMLPADRALTVQLDFREAGD